MEGKHFLSGVVGAMVVIVLLLIAACGFKLYDYSPIYIIGNNKASIPVDSLCVQGYSTDSLKLVSTKIELLKEMEAKGILLTPSEYTSQISSFYNTIITFLIFLFALFSFIGYYSIRLLSKKDVQKTIEDMLDDSVRFREQTTQSITAVISDTFATKDELDQLRNATDLSLRDIRSIRSTTTSSTEDVVDEIIDED